MLQPKKLKFKKIRKVQVHGIETKVYNPTLGTYGIKSLCSGRITSQQIESIRKLVSRKMQKFGFIRLKIFPLFSVTQKPAEVRMGKGKGNVKFWCFPIKPGRLLLEFYGVNDALAKEINNIINSKLPLKTKLIKFI
uniref:ribosomal protein L16 n=1 Tax=Cryptomonas gyropyrenoidosa TaxID=233257 RepID=UPI002799064E|nr:ribosomal protein L16 [Cryptomonas gyropyrenoidosa]WFQ82683.1 ribosomal protein L16 [Cryptomonas gyropyrenoidosa]